MNDLDGSHATKLFKVIRTIMNGLRILLSPKKFYEELRDFRKIDKKAFYCLFGAPGFGIVIIISILSFAPDHITTTPQSLKAIVGLKELKVFPANLLTLLQFVGFVFFINLIYWTGTKKDKEKLCLAANFNFYYFGTFFAFICFGVAIFTLMKMFQFESGLIGYILGIAFVAFVWRYVQIQGWIYKIHWVLSTVIFLISNLIWWHIFLPFFRMLA